MAAADFFLGRADLAKLSVLAALKLLPCFLKDPIRKITCPYTIHS